jgi:uncharacterized protein DUF1592/uncharacterized protein DUF1588/uncharacterized protein DUF1595/uncharacterized protein DUF1587/uncharacterized protein DUF1585
MHRVASAALVAIACLTLSGCLAETRLPDTGVGRVRRLSNREYASSVSDLLGGDARADLAFPEETYTNGYDNGSSDLVAQYDRIEIYQAMAESLAAKAVDRRLPTLLSGCDPSRDGEATCREAFYAGFVRRAYRRPPTSAEIGRLEEVFRAGSAAGGFWLGLETAVEAVLQSPSFLYREEIGADPWARVEYRLTPYEIASELAFLILGSIPDDALLAAAEEGRLETTGDLEREVRRLFADDRAKDNLIRFIDAWLAIDRITSTTKDRNLYPRFGHKLALEMAAESDRFVDHVLSSGSGDLRELFTSNRAYVTPSLAVLYDLATSTSAFSDPEAVMEVDLDPTVRSGILTRAAYLSVHASLDSSGPIPRGVFFLQALLCAPPPPPPGDVASRISARPADPDQTTRERFAAHAEDPFCANCHRAIDGIGFGFEGFDAIGRHRTLDHGKTVDTTGDLVGTDIDGPFRGAAELSRKLIESRELAQCAVTQMFRYAMGRAEDERDRATIDALSGSFTVDRRLSDLLLAIASDRAFFYRSTEVE